MYNGEFNIHGDYIRYKFSQDVYIKYFESHKSNPDFSQYEYEIAFKLYETQIKYLKLLQLRKEVTINKFIEPFKVTPTEYCHYIYFRKTMNIELLESMIEYWENA